MRWWLSASRSWRHCGRGRRKPPRGTAKTGTTPSASAGTPSAGPTSSEKAAFVARANDICQSGNTRQRALPSPTSNAQKFDRVDQAIAITSDVVAQIKALPQPPGDEATLAALYAKYQTVIDLGRQEVAALKGGQASQADTLNGQLNAATQAANDASIAYGLTICGS